MHVSVQLLEVLSDETGVSSVSLGFGLFIGMGCFLMFVWTLAMFEVCCSHRHVFCVLLCVAKTCSIFLAFDSLSPCFLIFLGCWMGGFWCFFSANGRTVIRVNKN